MKEKFAVLFDGGFVTKKLQQTLGRYPVVADIEAEAQRIVSHASLTDCTLMRYYFYDAPPLDKVIENPIDHRKINLGLSARAKEAKALQEGLELTPHFAVRHGETVFHGWKLGSSATRDMQANPRAPMAKDFVPDIKQKGVDLRIGLDIARIALRHLAQIIVVVAGDSDLVPAFRFARREGIRVYLDHMGHAVNRELKAHVDLIL
jgi:uncharacterized LabA/DUF88 family protein